jgi:hypothetical protein
MQQARRAYAQGHPCHGVLDGEGALPEPVLRSLRRLRTAVDDDFLTEDEALVYHGFLGPLDAQVAEAWAHLLQECHQDQPSDAPLPATPGLAARRKAADQATREMRFMRRALTATRKAAREKLLAQPKEDSDRNPLHPLQHQAISILQQLIDDPRHRFVEQDYDVD